MNYVCTLIAVKDMEQSKRFYRELLDQEVSEDFGANVILTGGFALQSADSWGSFIHKSPSEIAYGNHDAELYFEEDDLDHFLQKLSQFEVEYVHPVKEHSWGQRVIRFYDPDKHIIEVGETIQLVARRWMDSGLTLAQTAVRMDVSEEYVKALLR